MNNLEKSSQTENGVLMSSVEIAELTGKQHKHVKFDIRKMLEELNLQCADFTAHQKDSRNRTQEVFNLDKRLTNILITGYSIKLRAAVIDRLDELEKKVVSLIPQNYSEALRLAADQAETIETQYKLIESQKPAMNFLEKLAGQKGSVNIGAFAKMLCDDGFNIGQQRLFGWLRSYGYLMQNNDPKQRFIDQKLFEVTTGAVSGSSTGRIWKQTKITPKGMIKFSALLDECPEFKKGA